MKRLTFLVALLFSQLALAQGLYQGPTGVASTISNNPQTFTGVVVISPNIGNGEQSLKVYDSSNQLFGIGLTGGGAARTSFYSSAGALVGVIDHEATPFTILGNTNIGIAITADGSGGVTVTPGTSGSFRVLGPGEQDFDFALDAVAWSIQDNNVDRFKWTPSLTAGGNVRYGQYDQSGNLVLFVDTTAGAATISSNTSQALNITAGGSADLTLDAGDTINIAQPVRFTKAIQSATEASNAITATSTRVDITAESAGVDQLDTVNGLEDGEFIFLKAATGQAITVAEAGNIKVAGATIVLSTTLWTLFQYDGTQSKLVQVSAVLTD